MSTVYETQPHFVAYLDLLAGKHLIKAEEDESLNRMHSLLQVAKDSGAHSANAIFPKCKIKIFSDNIIIACRLTGSPAKDYSRILSAFMLVSALQIVGLEMYHYLFRGSATIGNLFIDNVMVWGSALVRATDMEETEAIYPRVIVDDNLLEMLAEDRERGEGFSKYSLARDTDGRWYLDYLSAYFRLPHSAESTAFIGENRALFLQKTDGASDAVREKLLWQIAYLDRCETLAQAAVREAEERERERSDEQALVLCETPRSAEARQALEKAAEARAAAQKADDAKLAAARAAEKKNVAAKAARARSAVAKSAGAKAAAAKAVEAKATAVKAAATTEAVARTAEAAAAETKARVAGAKAAAAEVLRSEEKKRRHDGERLPEGRKNRDE